MQGVESTKLLKQARSLLLNSALPQAPKGVHYEIRMIANAMAISERVLLFGQGTEIKESELFNELFDSHERNPFELERILAKRIRNGVLNSDDDEWQRVCSYLRLITLNRLRITNPKIIKKKRLL